MAYHYINYSVVGQRFDGSQEMLEAWKRFAAVEYEKEKANPRGHCSTCGHFYWTCPVDWDLEKVYYCLPACSQGCTWMDKL